MTKKNWQDIGDPNIRHKMKAQEQQQRTQPPPPSQMQGGLQWTNYAQNIASGLTTVPSKPYTRDWMVEQQAQQADTFAKWDWKNPEQLGPQGQTLPVLAQGWSPNGEADFGEGLGGWARKFASGVEEAYWSGREDGLRITGLTKAVTKKVEGDAAGTAHLEQMAENRKPQSETMANFTGAAEATKAIGEGLLWGVLDLLGKPAQIAERAIGATVLTLADQAQGKSTDFKRNYEASRLAYSMVFDSTIRAEMNRRIDAGERPDFAAMEVQQGKQWTMWPELIGQMVVDPLLVVGWIGKARKAAKIEKAAYEALHTVVDADVAKIITEAGHLGDGAITADAINTVMRSQEGLAAVGGHAEKIAEAKKALGDLAGAYGANALTSDAKVGHMANEVNQVLLHIVNNSSTDEALEFMRAMVMSTSDDAFKRAEGVATMMRFKDPVSLFSRSGNTTTAMLSHMVTEFGDTWIDDMAKAMKTGGKPELINMLMSRVDKAGNALYPPVVDMLAAEKRVSTVLADVGEVLTKDGKVLTADGKVLAGVSTADVRLAKMAKDLPTHVKTLAQWHERLQRFPVGPLNRFFVGAYLGWNPGYAARNWANNMVTIFTDYGARGLWGNADVEYAAATKLHGGAEVLFGAEAFGPAGQIGKAEGIAKSETGIKAVLKSAVEGVKSGAGISKGPAEIFEANAAKKIVAKTYKQTFQKGMKAMIRASEPQLRAAGYTDDFIRRLPSLLEQNYGDVEAVIKQVRAEHASGLVSLFNDVSRVSPEQRAMLEGFGHWDAYVEKVLKAETPELAQKGADDIFAKMKELANEVYGSGMTTETEEGRFLQRAASEGGLGQLRGQMIEIKQSVNNKTVEVAQSVMAQADREAENLIAKTGQTLDIPTMKQARNIIGPGWGADASQLSRTNQGLANAVYEAAKKKGANFEELWRSNKSLFAELGEPPPGMDYKHFTDALWHQYYKQSDVIWNGARDKAVEGVTGYLDDLAKAGVKVKPEWKQAIDSAMENARKYENVQFGMNRALEAADGPLQAYGTRTAEIAGIAKRYGVATATVQGGTFVPTDEHVLNIIRKYAGTRYKSLEEVPAYIAEAAFAKRAGVAPAGNLMRLAKRYGVASEDEAVKIVNKFLEKHYGVSAADTPVPQIKDLTATTEDVLRKALRDRLVSGEGEIPNGMKYEEFMQIQDELAKGAEKIAPPPPDASAPHLSQLAADRLADGDFEEIHQWMSDDIAKNFHAQQVADPVTEKMLQTLEREMGQKVAETRLVSQYVAKASRDFTLLDYSQKKYYDVALAYLYPFGFWHRGTYANWLKRVATNPAILGAYSRYKDQMATIHADMPEWWKYNLNSNDLPGIETEHPLFFNLEAALWPLNGITNTDFNDPYKRTNWWTYTLDFANRFGPSTWTPINMVTGLVLHQQGETEAGDRWLGRLVPQTNQIKALGSLFGISNLETDPFVTFLMDGLDPYERRRVGRALSAMDQEAKDGISPYTSEQIYDAGAQRSGPIWDEAVKRAVSQRAMPNLTSFMLGVGFKARTQEDMAVDQFYNDYYRLWGMEPNLKPDEFRNAMDGLRQKYPFMETVLISRRDGLDRDRGLAYNALSRIPPGQSTNYADAVGIDPALLGQFYDSKGHMEDWSKADQQEFMAGVIRLDLYSNPKRHNPPGVVIRQGCLWGYAGPDEKGPRRGHLRQD